MRRGPHLQVRFKALNLNATVITDELKGKREDEAMF